MWKSIFELQSCLETLIVVKQIILPGSVRSLGIKMLMAYVAEFENMDWEMSKVGRLPQIDMNAKDEINYLIAGIDSTFVH